MTQHKHRGGGKMIGKKVKGQQRMWDGGVNGERRNKRVGNGNRNDFRIRKYAAKSCKQTEGEEGKI